MKMLLIDGNSMLFRGFYATYYTNMMKTSTGIYTNAVFAFANMLNKAMDMIHPDYLVVALDKGKHTFRHDLSEDYKGGRKPAPEELVPQFAMIREYLDAYNIRYLEYDDIEADDIIGTLSKKYHDVDVAILSSDRDLLQLIDNTTTVYLMKKGLTDIVAMDENALLEEWGVKPSQVIDMKGLMGDSSDNIKGVNGIGPKTATKLLNQYGTIENLYEHVDELKGKVKENLINDKDSAFLSKMLATIKTDVNIDYSLDEFKNDIDIDGVNDFYNKYEMFSLVRKNAVQKKEHKYIRHSRASEKALKNGTFIYFVSDHFTYYNPKLYGVAFANDDTLEYIPYEDFLNDKKALDFVASDSLKYVYDLKFLLHAASVNGFTIGKNTNDIMLMAFLTNNYLDSIEAILNEYHLGDIIDIQDVYGTEKKRKLVDTVLEAKRATGIADGLYHSIDKLNDKLEKENLNGLYYNVELPLTYVLYDMEKEGICCDAKTLDDISVEYEDIISKCEEEIYSLAHHEFNINSPKQLAEVLFDELGLPMNKKRSTNAESLMQIEAYHPIIKVIIQYRKYTKLQSSYAQGLKRYIADDNKIHTIFSQTVTQTGRLSSYDPNLQNISVRDEDGKLIRKAFVASGENKVLISSDYSQIELRMLSSMACEKRMIDAFNEGVDIHTKTAMDIFKLPESEITGSLRRQAKAINFGVVYGISDFGLSKQASLSIKDAKRYIEEYFLTYPNIKKFLDESVEFCKEHGYVTTILNRRRYIKEIHDNNYMVKEFGKRAAMNSRVQGSAADLIKIAMINIFNEIKRCGLKSKLVLQIHDELIFDVFEDEKDEMIRIIKEGMKNAMKLNVTLDSSLSVAYSWYDAK